MPTEPIQLTIQIRLSEDSDAEELDGLTRRLRRNLEDLGVESAKLVNGGLRPEGTKAIDPITLGAIALATMPVALPKLVEFLQAWSMRGQGRIVKIKTSTVELEFTPDKPLSTSEIMRLAKQLTERPAKKK